MTGGKKAELPNLFLHIFKGKGKRKNCPSEIMRMNEKVTKIIERHPSTRQAIDLLYRPKRRYRKNFVSTIKSRKEG